MGLRLSTIDQSLSQSVLFKKNTVMCCQRQVDGTIKKVVTVVIKSKFYKNDHFAPKWMENSHKVKRAQQCEERKHERAAAQRSGGGIHLGTQEACKEPGRA